MPPVDVFSWCRRLPPAARIAVPVALALLVGVSIVGGVLSHATRITLFASALKPEQLAEVEERLAEWNVSYSENGGNVLVDSGRRNDLLLRLSLAGVPHSHVATTSEALANVGVLTPEAVIDAQTRAGLAGDIEVGLRGVNGIDDARVIIAPAKQAQFADESTRDASASVRLRLHPGAQLSAPAIAGIRAFVSASVPGLEASHVTILDDRGIALGNANSNDDGDLERSLQSALDATLGPGVALVRVHTEVDRATTERRDVRRSPLGSSPIARDDSGETFGEGSKHYEKHALHDDRGSETNEVVSRADPGTLIRVSTAVYVDRARAVDIPNIRALAAATVGFDARRGDSLVVQAMDFSPAPPPKRDGWWLAYNAIVPLLPVLLSIVAFVFGARTLVPAVAAAWKRYAQSASIARTTQTIAGFAPAQVRGALAHEPPHAAAAIISALPAATAAAVLELYPQHEREAIVRRMQRASTAFVPDVQELLGKRV